MAGGGPLASEMIRINHYGVDATRGVVQSSLAALGGALAEHGRSVDLEGARRAAGESWD
jgi:aspartate aminotransferase-like enzyme